jgi:two-component system cell cycle response regulator
MDADDRHGHQAGDYVLVEVSRQLQDGLPSNDMVARWAGEEFVTLLRNCRIDDALTIAEKIRGRIADTPFDDSWLGRADEALYKSKRSGRNAVRAY